MFRCITGALLALSVGHTSPAAADVSELFDPAAIARNMCGGAGARESTLSTLVQVAQSHPAPAPKARPPLFDNLGSHSFKVTTANTEARAYFDQGLRLAYGFNHAEAIRAFKAAQSIDPTCAMCFWGEAWALGPNINLLMPKGDTGAAIRAARRAKDLAVAASPRERALADAIASRYAEDPEADRKALDKAYAAAMFAAHRQFPDDPDVAVLAVEAAMVATPWVYWRDGGREPVAEMAEAHPLLESVLKGHPRHAGAIHYYIHVMENSLWPEKAEPYADSLAALMPGAGHMVHMPSHTYFQIGRYKDSLDANVAAVAADEAYFRVAEPSAIYRAGYYPHNIHFALESAAMAGDADGALVHADKLAAAIPKAAFRDVVQAQPIGLAPMFAQLRFAEPATVLALPDPGDDVPFMKAAWHYARGVAHVMAGDPAIADTELAALIALRSNADLAVLEQNAIPAANVLDIAVAVLHGRIAGARGDWTSAVQHFDAAAKKQDDLAYMEPPYWYYPTRQSLGHALLKAGRPKEAVDALRISLLDAPNNGWALSVLADAAAAAGDSAGASEYRKLYEKAWVGRRPPDPRRL
ncbi:MAG: hypothetical protein FJX59_00445 [Alphaproteobacteria bacterium]|nr:hypothetical protein [Alphaproteobacteria bacterium]